MAPAEPGTRADHRARPPEAAVWRAQGGPAFDERFPATPAASRHPALRGEHTYVKFQQDPCQVHRFVFIAADPMNIMTMSSIYQYV